MSASSRAPPSATRTYSRPSARAIDFAMDVLPTPGGPVKSRIGPFAMARALASVVSVIVRSSSSPFARATASRRSLRALSLAAGNSPVRGHLLGELLRAQLAHGEELEHAVLHVLQAVVILVEHVDRRALRSSWSSERVFHGSSAIHSR